MDAVGNLELAWSQGYAGQTVEYVKTGVMCFKCGNNIKLIDNTGVERMFTGPEEGLGQVAAHGIKKLFAYADMSINPKIHIYNYPDFKKKKVLKGGAKLEYVNLTFSTSEYMASISGMPDYELAIWNFQEGEKLIRQLVSDKIHIHVAFNPADWHQLCTSTEKAITLWTLEQCDTRTICNKKRLQMPKEDAELGTYTSSGEKVETNEPIHSRCSTRLSRMTIIIPRHVVAGIKTEEAYKFDEHEDTWVRMIPQHHCWTPTGEVLLGCKGGQLVKIDPESQTVQVMLNPSVTPFGEHTHSDLAQPTTESGKRSTKLSFGRTISNAPSVQSVVPMPIPETSTTINQVALHKKGLFMAGDDGFIYHIELSHRGITLVQKHKITKDDCSISCLTFDPPHNRLTVGTKEGALFLCNPLKLAESEMLFSVHHGNFVAVDVLDPGSDTVVSIREDGEFQVWNVETAKLLASIPVGSKVRSLSCSPLAHVAAIGDNKGFVYFVEVSNLSEPRVVRRIRMHRSPINHLAFNENGMFLLTASNDGHMFVLDGRPTRNFASLGHIDLPGNVFAMTTQLDEKNGGTTKVVVTTDFNKKCTDTGATTVISVELPADLAQDVSSKHMSLHAKFKDTVVKKMQFSIAHPIYGATITSNNIMFGLSQSAEYSRRLLKFHFPTGISQKVISPSKEYFGHQLIGGSLKMSPHHKWVGSYGTDGRVMVRAIGALERAVDVYAHDFSTGGVSNIVFTSDTYRLITTGYDGVMSCYKWNFTSSGASKAKQAMQEAATRHAKLADIGAGETDALKEMSTWLPVPDEPRASFVHTPEELEEAKDEAIAKAIEADEVYSALPSVPPVNPTWLELQEHEAIKAEDEQYATFKHELRLQIREMRRKIQVMIKENDAVPDIEKLSHPEFDLDLDEQLRLQGKGEIEVCKIREQIEFENLGKMYLAELIKKECWEDMDTKGRGLCAFTSSLVVYNYPLRKRNLAEFDELDRIMQQRRVEKAELQNRITLVETRSKSTMFSSGITKSTMFSSGGEEDFLDLEDVETGKESVATIGSLAMSYGGNCDLLYSQFELHTREQKMNQIVLLKDIIHRVREAFNKEFDEIYEKKKQEMGKIKEKNKRIRKIHQDLKLPDQFEDPEFGEIEQPELLLTVRDEEVTVEKYLTEDERKAKEKAEKEEEERRRKEQKDNWRERGLEDMMDGVLEMRKEDELKKDVPIPAFMTAKSPEEWSEDERKLALEYEKKCKDLEDEREKYRKQLEIELKKLQVLNDERMEQFDEVIYALFDRKVKSEMVIFQEEVKIVRMRLSLLLEEELNNREQDLVSLLDHKMKMKEKSTKSVMEVRRQVDVYREKYDILVVEDKLLDKSFKKEFHEASAVQLDHLYKMFRKRPRVHRMKGSESPIYDPASGNPFAELPTPSYTAEMSKVAMEAALQELDKFANAPDNVDEEMWRHLCHYRRQKVDSEHMMKQKAQVLADMNTFLQKRIDEDEHVGQDINELSNTITKLKEDKLRFACNLEVQLVLKQGQVEIDNSAFIPDFQNSLLVHRSVIEDLNTKIRNLGEHKIASMEDSKDFRKGIIQLEWEYKRMTMEMVDLQNKMRDIQNMKVTREIQSYLNQEDHEARKAYEIAILEQTVDVQRRQHERTVQDRKRSLTDLKRTIRGKKDDNSMLNTELNDINVAVNERRHIHEVVADKTTSFDHEEKYRDIVQRRKLVDLAKSQAQEVAVLRAEVERLRMRTFPALVQVER